MEEMVHNIVNNTFKIYPIEKAKEIVAEKILWYEMKILQLEEKLEQYEQNSYKVVNSYE